MQTDKNKLIFPPDHHTPSILHPPPPPSRPPPLPGVGGGGGWGGGEVSARQEHPSFLLHSCTGLVCRAGKQRVSLFKHYVAVLGETSASHVIVIKLKRRVVLVSQRDDEIQTSLCKLLLIPPPLSVSPLSAQSIIIVNLLSVPLLYEGCLKNKSLQCLCRSPPPPPHPPLAWTKSGSDAQEVVVCSPPPSPEAIVCLIGCLI